MEVTKSASPLATADSLSLTKVLLNWQFSSFPTCTSILCFLYFAVSRIRSSLYRFIDVFDAQMAVVDVGINFFLVSFNTFLMICCFVSWESLYFFYREQYI